MYKKTVDIVKRFEVDLPRLISLTQPSVRALGSEACVEADA